LDELRAGETRWQSAAENIASQKNPDNTIDGQTFYEWRMAPIQAWVDKYLADNGLSTKNKTDFQKVEIIKKIIDDGWLEEFIGLWRPGFKHDAQDCAARAEAIKFLMIAMDFECFDIVSGLWGSTPHGWNAYWDSGVNAVRFLDANPNANVWNLYVDELDEQTHTLD
jgi:hypothetical protein